MVAASLKVGSLLWGWIRERSLIGSLQGVAFGIIFLPLLFLYLPVGYQLSYVNFTYGVHGLDPEYKAQLPQIFLRIALYTYLLEILVRGVFLRFLLRRFSWQKSFWIHLACLNAIAIPALFYFKWSFGMLGFFRGMLLENLLMAFWTLFFLKTGSLLLTGLMHAGEIFLRMVLVNDVAASFETLYFYSSASDDFYWIMIAMTLFVVSILVFINQKFKMIELQDLTNG